MYTKNKRSKNVGKIYGAGHHLTTLYLKGGALIRADIGVFGGSGFYDLAADFEEIWVNTPYGAPSDKISIGTMAKKRVAFLPRHGRDHIYPPHMINYRANVYAMKKLGVTHIFGPCACGSLQPHIKPGHFVIADQFINKTWGRADTYYEGPVTTHVSAADPYCPRMREAVIQAGKSVGNCMHAQGTMVVIQGPRFSTRAESRLFSKSGGDIIGMTQYPEAILARELELCYVNISLVTDYDVGLDNHDDIQPVSHEKVLKVFQENLTNLQRLLQTTISQLSLERNCPCSSALDTVR